jgi:hypothetical protein
VTIEAARRVALLLPGQPPGRGYADYQGRPLADSVTTAIAVRESFTDEVLEGLLPLLRHRAAVGLWRLAAAATTTGAEHDLYQQQLQLSERADELGSRNLLPADERARLERLDTLTDQLRYGDLGWHDPWRVTVVRHLARVLLTGVDANANELALYQQRESPWDEWRGDLEEDGGRLIHPLLRGLRSPLTEVEGRGGTTVWRAERRLTLDELPTRLATHANTLGPASHRVDPPEWMLLEPATWWRLEAARAPAPLPPRWADAVARHALLTFDLGSRRFVWPVTGQSQAPAQIPSLELVLGRAAGLAPAEIAERLLLALPAEGGPARLPAAIALEAGFITRDDLPALEAEAAAEDERNARSLLSSPLVKELDTAFLGQLLDAVEDIPRFVALLAAAGIEFERQVPSWPWGVDSLADALIRGAPAPALVWLAGDVFERCAERLRESETDAWFSAFKRYRHEGRPRRRRRM